MDFGWRRTLQALALAGVAATAAPAFAGTDPMEVVQALYAQPSLALGGPQSAGYLAEDLMTAMRSASGRSGSSGPVGFDYRYGARETEISGFELLPQVDNDQAKVVAVFKNFGKPESVDWTLCRDHGGDWRIADASSNTGPQDWDLRQILHLPVDDIRC